MIARFDRFRFDPDIPRLEDASGPIYLNAKALEVLRVLISAGGRPVTSEEILREVWPDTHVVDGVIKVRIAELRRALGDSAAQPRFIATAHRRGYRFIAKIDEANATSSAFSVPESPLLAGRRRETAMLEERLSQALSGDRQMVFISGDPGIGKTALVDHFVAAALKKGALTVAHGQCREQFGSSEPYLPMLEAVGGLARESAAARALLRRYAPAWMVQLPWLIEQSDREKLAGELLGTVRDRMLREIGEFLEAMAAEQPLILVLEDLHWSDPSTVDLISLLAERRERARFMLLATYRPVELVLARHPLRGLSHRLVSRRRARELALDHLSSEAVAEYLKQRFSGNHIPAEAAGLVHKRSDGIPLFMIALIDHLVSRGAIAERNHRWEFADTFRPDLRTIPETLRRLVEEQSARLDLKDRELLGGASLVGVEFPAVAAAAAAQTELREADERLERLAAAGWLIHHVGAVRWPNGTVSERYAFRHALYRETLAAAQTPRRSAEAHLRIGETLERAYGERASESAAELAVHFEKAGSLFRAAHYHRLAAETAARRFALVEAQVHLEKGLGLLRSLPPAHERNREELMIQSALGQVGTAAIGYSADAVERAYARAAELAADMPQEPSSFPLLHGIFAYYFSRCEMDRALALAHRNLTIAQASGDRTALLQAHQALWATHFFRGEFAEALRHLDLGEPFYDPSEHLNYVSLYAHDPKVSALSYRSFVLWELGHIQRALETSREAVQHAESLREPMSLAFALVHAAWLRLCRREPKEAQQHAEAALALARAKGLLHWATYALWFRGWALVEQGLVAQGLADMEEAFRLSGDGSATLDNNALLLLAIGRLRASCLDAARVLIEQVNKRLAATGQRFREAEVYRFDAELALAEAGGPRRAPAAVRERAQALLRSAVECARKQGARTLELRSMTALARLCCHGAKARQIRSDLATLLRTFSEGFDTADLTQARELLI